MNRKFAVSVRHGACCALVAPPLAHISTAAAATDGAEHQRFVGAPPTILLPVKVAPISEKTRPASRWYGGPLFKIESSTFRLEDIECLFFFFNGRVLGGSGGENILTILCGLSEDIVAGRGWAAR